MNRAMAAAVGAALVVAAWAVAAVTPTDDDTVAPFTVIAQLGEAAAGRNIAVTVFGVHRAEYISTDAWNAKGNWVVFNLDAEAVVSEIGGSLDLATLEVSGSTYQASERPESLFDTGLAVGVPRSGSIAFELADTVQGGTGVLRIGVNTDTRLDSVIELEVDLDEIERESEVKLITTDWSTR